MDKQEKPGASAYLIILVYRLCTSKVHHLATYGTHVLVQTKSMSEVHANQRCMHTVRANHDAHGSRLTSHAYMHILNVRFYIIDLLCTRRLCCEYFQKCAESCSCLTCV